MTTDPARLLATEDDAFTASLLRSARDGDADAARTHKAAVLGAAGGAAIGGAAIAAGKLAPRGIFSLLGGKWLGGAALAVTATAGVAATFLWPPAAPLGPSAHIGTPAEHAAATVPPRDPATPDDTSAQSPVVAPERRATASPTPPPAVDEADPAATRPPTAAGSPGEPPAKTAAAPTTAASATTSDGAPSSPPASAPTTTSPTTTAAPATSTTAAAAPTSAASGLSDEVAALRAAHEALGRGQAARCLEAVDAYFAKFPAGHLAAEARFLRVQALAGAGRRAEAAALARSMLARNPKSPYAPRLRAIAGEDAAPKAQ